jgi:uncharacterized cupredoxin-like copper-binding protein
LRGLAAILAIAVLATTLAACGGDEQTTPSENVAATAPQKGDGAKGGKGDGDAAVWGTEKSPEEEEHPGQAEFGSPPLEFEADPDGATAFTKTHVTATEGNVTIEFTNPQSTPHNVAIEALPSRGRVVTDTVKEGFDAKTVTLNTDEKFVFYCTIPGHREAGMEGVVTVKPS